MHLERRISHLGATDLLENREPSQRRMGALNSYVPSYFDDIFAFARILRDFTHSSQVALWDTDRKAIQKFCRKYMGLDRKPASVTPAPIKKGITARFSSAFLRRVKEPALHTKQQDALTRPMSAVAKELDQLLNTLSSPKSP